MNTRINEIDMKVKEAVAVHSKERELNIASIKLVAYFERVRASILLQLTTEDFATHIGLTKDQYWKRAAAARALEHSKVISELFKTGKISLSHVAMIAGKLTRANEAIIAKGITGTSVEEARTFLSRVKKDGSLKSKEDAIVKITLNFTLAQLEQLKRAREILAHSGELPSDEHIMGEALTALLEKRDPIRKAARAAERSRKKDAADVPASEQEKDETTPRTPKPARVTHKNIRPVVPAALKHEVWQRDQGQCTFKDHRGKRCQECTMLELDHKIMWCRGGGHSANNVFLMCRYHNQSSAELALGRPLYQSQEFR